jgi:hypothetical protein
MTRCNGTGKENLFQMKKGEIIFFDLIDGVLTRRSIEISKI